MTECQHLPSTCNSNGVQGAQALLSWGLELGTPVPGHGDLGNEQPDMAGRLAAHALCESGKAVGCSGPAFLICSLLSGHLQGPQEPLQPSRSAQRLCKSLGSLQLKAQGPALGTPQKGPAGHPMPSNLFHCPPCLFLRLCSSPSRDPTALVPAPPDTQNPPDVPSGPRGKGPWPFLLSPPHTGLGPRQGRRPWE